MSDVQLGFTGEVTVVTAVEISNTILSRSYATLEFKDGKLLGIKKAWAAEPCKFALTTPLPGDFQGKS